ncbi:hypothetical protein AURDEDRAFT_189096 [Auricularia subglabra TFB-10046 SS5]|uniref:Uncharacterized protein n=1 Tax=Auricularia subglabra (strain TFB-10046 / SS5) TaxID=717982 RepID=J0L9S1_AURST|nr:hypothetical protein AURDEDRAFT_189096 [Auricularia subglabra TFB-10046 SS5]
MASDARRWRAERVKADEAALVEAQARLQASIAQQADAQRVLDDVTRGVVDLRDLTQSLATRLHESRYALLRQCMASLPDDVLRCIFEATVRDGDPLDAQGLHTPFTLAAACSRWRVVALASPILWSYISFVPKDEHGSVALDAAEARIATLLSRSRAAPLHILVVFWTATGDPETDEYRAFNRIFQTIGSHASRWKTATIYLPEAEDLSPIDFLKGPTPLLQELGVSMGDPGRESFAGPGTAFLPYTPNLRTLDLIETGVGCSPRSDFSALARLRIGPGACTDEELYDYLRRAPVLEELSVRIPISHAPQARIDLPALEFLSVGSESQALITQPTSSLLALPKLTVLFLSCVPDDSMASFLDAVSATVRGLYLHQRLTVEHLAVLHRLKNVEELAFIDTPKKTIDKATLDRLSSSDPPIWPRLTVLRDLAYAEGLDEHILHLLAARNPPLEPEGTASPSTTALPCRLRELNFNGAAPGWLVQEVARALAL